ncbi:sulfatase-like hydrolase/transferase [Haladaptatus halobius]|uniref:sulfatase-like hydrolase/transferase n=1 Tax=Haladaptatus halobius TaxID=2884875 RepID=UPI001D0BE39E|nr:sulfatase-like hydrolase/transferase [Haladaptatus halobius]
MTNIAVVVLDTLRKDTFDEHFGWLPGRRFERAYSTANWTVPAHASLFTGRYASEVGVHAKNNYLDCSEPTLAERLRDSGYKTRAFSANTNVTGHFDFDRGFTDFRVPEKFEYMNDKTVFDWREFSRNTSTSGVEKYLRGVYECFISDCATLPSLKAGLQLKRDRNDAVEYGGALEAQTEIEEIDFGGREFLFLNLMEAHEPYRAPAKYMTVEEPSMTNAVGDRQFGDGVDAEQTTQAYKDCIRYLSDIYQEIFHLLDEHFDYIITLSDHGEMLGEHGAWGHEHGVFNELTNVPLCISGSELSGTCTETVNLHDVHQTVLDLAGVDGSSRGESLLENVEGREILTEYMGLTSWSERRFDADREFEKYDRTLHGYAATVDYYGCETLDGFQEYGSERVNNPQKRIEQLLSELDVRDVNSDNEIPDEVKQQLEDLGYA